jgi:hypothetical protein
MHRAQHHGGNLPVTGSLRPKDKIDFGRRPNILTLRRSGGFHAIDLVLSHRFARPVILGRPGPAASDDRRGHRSSTADPRTAANFRTGSNEAAYASRFHACGKRTQRLHRGICTGRYKANPILHGSTAAGGHRSRLGRIGPGWLYKNSKSGPMQRSRSRDRRHNYLRWNSQRARESEKQTLTKSRPKTVSRLREASSKPSSFTCT